MWASMGTPPSGNFFLYGDFFAAIFSILCFFLYVGAYVSYYFLIMGTFYDDGRQLGKLASQNARGEGWGNADPPLKYKEM